MKRIFVLFAFVLTATFAQAQSTQVVENPSERAHARALGLQKQLGLSDEQTTKIEAIILASNTEIETINNDATKTQEQKDTAISEVRNKKEKDIQAILTPDQLIKYNEIKLQRERRKNASNQEQD